MRERSLKKLERELRGELLKTASRLLPAAEAAGKNGRPNLLRAIIAISRATSGTETAKTRHELTTKGIEQRPRGAAAPGEADEAGEIQELLSGWKDNPEIPEETA